MLLSLRVPRDPDSKWNASIRFYCTSKNKQTFLAHGSICCQVDYKLEKSCFMSYWVSRNDFLNEIAILWPCIFICYWLLGRKPSLVEIIGQSLLPYFRFCAVNYVWPIRDYKGLNQCLSSSSLYILFLLAVRVGR